MRFISPNLLYRIFVIVTITVACLLGAPAEAGQTSASPVATGRVNSTHTTNDPASAPADPKMKIGPGDLIEVTVYDEADLHQIVRLNDVGDGTFSFIGSLHLAGLTTGQAEVLIARKLKDGNYLLAPQVGVIIREYSTQGVSVLGEVKTPGVYNVAGGQSLLDVLAAAGGTTTLAGASVTIQRAADASTVTIALLQDAHHSLSSNVPLYPGDKVIVPRAGLVYVLGDVGRPGGFIMENDGQMSLLQALAMAGGTTHTSSTNGSRLLRKGPSGYMDVPIELNKMLKGKQGDVQLQAQDIVYIPSSNMKTAFTKAAPAMLAAASGALGSAVYVAAY